ncbi:hypothetical protein BN2127_JRS9_01886 [Bacillus subtilis]|nr:hypothetical protein NRS6131_01759 [Bacillus subtilis]CAI6260289.1 hypothetical protein NRS6131_06860 [Bacillus subtilis]CUB21992.1 hypothetical protein BN2127_JRS2_03856 [Bacillus subtilis]CUB50164.1 hypothetical protein BN2127_JRS11_03608 [Bacillus subtilis]CUB55739.1 hypothetical protein BN2127_JRS9_01886 [Bacillus subtilis]
MMFGKGNRLNEYAEVTRPQYFEEQKQITVMTLTLFNYQEGLLLNRNEMCVTVSLWCECNSI